MFVLKLSFLNNKVAESDIDVDVLIQSFKAGTYIRYQAWMESDDIYKSTQSPFVVKSIKFNKSNGNVEYIELKELPEDKFGGW